MGDTKVLITVPTSETARKASWNDYFNTLDRPEGTMISMIHGQSPARNRNIGIRQAIEHKCTHVFFVDDDVVFKPDTLKRLLLHDKDAVTGLYLMRSYPHTPIIFDYADEKGRCRTHFLNNDEPNLIPVVAAGLGCCLIKTIVFESMEEPWIRLGELEKDHWCDDIGFFRRFREHKFELFCDTSVLAGHTGYVTIWPNNVDGRWLTTYDTSGTGTASVHQLKEPENVSRNNVKAV